MPDRNLLAAEIDGLRRQLAENARNLNQCEARYDAVFNAAQTLIALCTVEGVVLDVNRKLLETTGARIEDCVGRNIWECSWYANQQEEAARLKAVIEEHPGQTLQYEARYATPEGGWAAYDIMIRPVRAQVGGDVRFIVIEARDLTAIRMAEERAHRSERMEALGLLTGGIAHDFNNFLTVVIGALDMVVRRPEKSNRGALIEAALEAAQKAEALNKQLLAFARRRPLAAQDVDVGAALRGLEPLLRKAVGEAVDMHVHVSAEAHSVRMESAQFEAAVLNLCLNARDAMPSGGRLDVDVRQAAREEARQAEIAGPAIVVAVSDTGEGIEPEVLPRVFDPFFTTKGAGHGTGLGLSQVYGFARQTGGGVDVASVPGKGSTFKLILPCAPAVRARPGRDTDVGEPLAIRSVLLVEDDEGVAGVSAAMLGELGLEVISAANGPDARRVLVSDDFDLLISDVIMPGGMNGVELAHWARSQRPGIKVLLVSGWSADTLVTASPDLPILQKPFDIATLKRAIERLV
ncbi:MAG TPA: ATP-binding protein [Phenylobacterium sp.]|uniref:ATP-binding protein n=1 Tax=Phenylobacterium sp. TaxID=1871053 RepID=UPI002B45EC8C|nr:ATP-binding protein [Phenylobacterium sp.]HKR86681.1 ATP-binding protein [Phenylobacterium sp.]